MSKSEVAGGTPQKKAQGTEAYTFRVDREKAEITNANAKRKGLVDLNNLNDWANDGRPKTGRDPDDPVDRAGDGRPKTRSPKVPTKSGHGFSGKTVDKDVLSGDDFSLASGDKVVSVSTDDDPHDEECPTEQGVDRQQRQLDNSRDACSLAMAITISQQGQGCHPNDGEDAIAIRAMTPAGQWQRCLRIGDGDDAISRM